MSGDSNIVNNNLIQNTIVYGIWLEGVHNRLTNNAIINCWNSALFVLGNAINNDILGNDIVCDYTPVYTGSHMDENLYYNNWNHFLVF